MGALAGQLGPVPVQYAAIWHPSPWLPHCLLVEAYPFAGQLSVLPEQYSSVSHTPADPRHFVVDGCLASAGHTIELPEQNSTLSHTSTDSRHFVVDGAGLQLLVDTLGLHAWHFALGLRAPAAYGFPSIRHSFLHVPVSLQIIPEPHEVPATTGAWPQAPAPLHWS